ncbi:unnamed protein product [Effrenium voratum]|uniref:Uncharacterized protein n=1 Tax=Effrenium voratum TaxID=2562239 RepID=A0AA36JMY1_9DINO|nr:unnamed protein product [Effrenium voratum]CAJ1431568.1 unnamed protein product [Effrenium voratum]
MARWHCGIPFLLLLLAVAASLKWWMDILPLVLPHLTVSRNDSNQSISELELGFGQMTAPDGDASGVLESLLRAAAPFVLVLQANVQGGTATFLKSVLNPDCVVVTPILNIPIVSRYSLAPTTDSLKVKVGSFSITCTSSELLLTLRNCTFSKVFINHPLGFSHSFITGLFSMQKRFISITHDYVWVFDKVQPTFSDLQTAEGGRRNYAFKELLPKLEMKTQTMATSQNFALFDHFKSLQAVPMPDYHSSEGQPTAASKDLVIGVIGDVSWIKGLEAVLQLSRLVPDGGKCEDMFVGSSYIQLGQWRIAPMDDMHLSISHQKGQTPLIFRSDGTMHMGPRTDYNAWTRDGACSELSVTSGRDFVQIGDWRMGTMSQHFVVSHRLNASHPSVLTNGKSKRADNFALNIWVLPAESSNVAFRADSMQIGSWSLFQTPQAFAILDSFGEAVTLKADGSAAQHDAPFGHFKWQPAEQRCSFPSSQVKVVVFGNVASMCHAGGNFHKQAFGNIREFNELLLRVRPNVLLIPAIWPETYSYTLTLAMLTNLPIIVRQSHVDFRAAILARAQEYPRAHFHDFNDMNGVLALANRVKGDTFTQVNPELVLPQQWKYLLTPSLYNVVLVASKIVTSTRPLWYHPKRSRFSPQERFEQTLGTISSIRHAIPQSFVVLIDNSRLDKTYYKHLKGVVDIFVNDAENQDLRHWTDESDAKQLGEAMLLLQGLHALQKHQVMYEQLFKLTGRYLVNAKFDFQRFDNSHNIFKRATIGKSVEQQKPYYAYTCFFKIHYAHTEAFHSALSSVVSELKELISQGMATFLHDDIESRLSLMLPDVVYIPSLGVSQRVSTWDTPDRDI